MWGLFGILMIGVAVSIFEVPPLVKNKDWRELIVFSIFLLAGLILNLLLSLDVDLPNPSDWLLNYSSLK